MHCLDIIIWFEADEMCHIKTKFIYRKILVTLAS